MADLPKAAIGRFYFAYFAGLGVFIPFWPLYLSQLGYSPSAIGQLMAVTLLTKIVAPNVWGWLADRLGQRMGLVRWGSVAAWLGFALVYQLRDSFWPLALALLGFSFCWNAVLPQFEANTLAHLGARGAYYARLRLWGSLGFIVIAQGLGVLLPLSGLDSVPYWLLLMLAFTALSSWSVTEAVSTRSAHLESPALWPLLRQPGVLALLLASALNQAGHAPYYGFFTVHVQSLGYSPAWAGSFWCLGVLAEIGLFLLVPKLLQRLGARLLLTVSMSLTAGRWLLLASGSGSLWLLLPAQTLHGFSFGVNHAVAMYLIHRYFPAAAANRGQGLYSSVGIGVGGAVGHLLGGGLWSIGGASYGFGWSAVCSVVAISLAWSLPRDANNQH